MQKPEVAIRQWQSLRDDPLLRVSEIARTLSVSRDTVKRWIRAGTLQGVKLGGIHRVRRSRVLALLGSDNNAESL